MTGDAELLGPIYDPTRSVILVASAGTGKTWRLVRRYLRIIAGRDPASGATWARPDQVVAVTFTRAAAAEMRARVFAALTRSSASTAKLDDDPVVRELLEQRTLGERLKLAELVAPAPIATLHSLCARLLAEFPELSGVPPDARPLEPAEQDLELDAFAASWLDRAIDEPGHRAHAPCVALLRAHPLGFVRRELRAMVDDRHWSLVELSRPGSRSSTAAIQDWRRPEAILAAREDFVRAQWRTYMHYIQAPLAPLVQACALLTRPNVKQLQLRERVVTILQRHLPEPHLDTIVGDIQGLVTTRPSAELGVLSGPLQQLRNGHRVLSTRRERGVMPDPAAALDRGHAEHLARWVELATLARADWVERLRARALLRYDDLEHLTWALLAEPRAQGHLRGRYRHLLVDEYQDINPMQAQIIDQLAALCGEGAGAKVFFVGDPKQSIYRFRGADPQVLQRAITLRTQLEADAEADAEADTEPDPEPDPAEVVTLVDNRRSSPTLARFFVQLFVPLFAGVLPWANVTDLGRPQELAVLRDVLDHAVVPWDGQLVVVREGDRLPGLGVDLLVRDRKHPAAHEALLGEADRVAIYLRGLLGGATLQEGGQNSDTRLEARELAILVPRWSLAEDYRAALERQGIAADLAGGRGLLELPEVRDLINVVRLWADERDELAALAVLRGPCFAISDLGLYVLARWPGVDRRVNEADPDLPEFTERDEVWEPWDDEDDEDDEGVDPWPRAHPRRIRELLRHGRLDPARAVAALAAAKVIVAEADETAASAAARLRARLEADAEALELGRERGLAFMREAGARSTADLLAELIAEYRLEAHWLAGPRGRRAVANAWRFVEHVRVLEPEGPDLQRLVTWLDAGAEPAPEGLISPEADAVTITTWHGSKGKEWPVVVVAGFGEFREAGARTSWSGAPVPTLDTAAGAAIPVPRIRGPHEGFIAPADPLHEPCANMEIPLEAAEAKRLVYVAMTRARDRLILSGEADARAHVHYDDKPWLNLDYRYDMSHLIGEPKPAFLCRRPIELLVAGLDLPAARPGDPVVRPRAATWSLAHLRIIDDAMLLAGLERELPRAPVKPVEVAPEPLRPPPPSTKPVQLGFAAFFDAPEPATTKPEPERRPISTWRAGPSMQLWSPSAGRSPWPVSELDWDMPLPARRPALLDDEEPQRLGDLFHRAMERWDFVGEPPRSRELEALVAVTHADREPSERRRIGSWLARCLELFVDEAELLAQLREARARGDLFHEVDLEALVADAQRGVERDHWIRGRIDLLWRDAAGLWNVLDYKVTSKVRSRAQMQDLQWEYGPQLMLYRKALERWRIRGEIQYLGRFGLWLAPAGKPMWLKFE